MGASSQPEPGIAARRIFRAEWKQLTAHERQVIEGVLHRISLPRDLNKELRDRRTLGELILSMLAALQAPIIMMSQNRQAARDRLEAEVDHEVNVRAELAIHHVDERLHAIEQRLLIDGCSMRNGDTLHVQSVDRSKT